MKKGFLLSKGIAYTPVLLLSIGVFLRLSLLTQQSLWYDEGVALALSDSVSWRENLAVMWDRQGGDKYQPLYYITLSYWRLLFGNSEYMIRLLSVVFGGFAIATVYFLARSLYGNRHALWSTALIASSSFCVYYSQEVRPYSLQLFLASLQLLLFSQALRSKPGSLKARIGFAVITAVNFLGGILLVLFSLGLWLSHLLVYRDIRNSLRWWLPAAIVSIPFVFYYLASPAAANPASDATNGLGIPVYQNAIFSLYGILVGVTYGPSLDMLRNVDSIQTLFIENWFAFTSVTLFAFVLAFILIRNTKRVFFQVKSAEINRFFLILFFVAFALAYLLAFVTKINWMPRHSFYLYLIVAVLMPSILQNQEQGSLNSTKGKSLFSQLGTIALTGLIVMNVFSLKNYFFNPEYWRDDYRAAAQHISDSIKPNEKSVLLWGTPRLMAFYGDNKTIDGRELSDSNLKEGIANLMGEDKAIFVAVNREFSWERSGVKSVKEQLCPSYRLASLREFQNFKLYYFSKSLDGDSSNSQNKNLCGEH